MITLYINGCRRDLLPTDRVIDIARSALASHKVTGQSSRLYCHGWDWGRIAAERHGNGSIVPMFRHKQRPARKAPEPPGVA